MRRWIRSHSRLALFALTVAAWLGAAAWRGGYWQAPRPTSPASRPVDPAQVEVLDGDTFVVGGRQVRLLGVDTPEKSAPWFDADQEPWATRASVLVRRDLDRADRVVLLTRGRTDVYGRELVHLLLDGEPLAVRLVAAGLAYSTVPRYGDGGFPGIAREIERRAKPPSFEEPRAWRRAHRRRER